MSPTDSVSHCARFVLLAIGVLFCRAVLATSATAESAGLAPRPFLATGLFCGGQTDDLIWAEGNARASGELIYVEGGLDIEWEPPSQRPGHRIGLAVSVDMGGEAGERLALGFGPRVTYCLGKRWALQAQAGLLAKRAGEEECANSLGSEYYSFNHGHQVRVGLVYRNKVSAVALWRALDYDVRLLPLQYAGQPFPDQQSSSGTAHALSIGVMVHGRIGFYASLGSLLLMGGLTALRALPDS